MLGRSDGQKRQLLANSGSAWSGLVLAVPALIGDIGGVGLRS